MEWKKSEELSKTTYDDLMAAVKRKNHGNIVFGVFLILVPVVLGMLLSYGGAPVPFVLVMALPAILGILFIVSALSEIQSFKSGDFEFCVGVIERVVVKRSSGHEKHNFSYVYADGLQCDPIRGIGVYEVGQEVLILQISNRYMCF